MRRTPVHTLDATGAADGKVPVVSGGKFVIGDAPGGGGAPLGWFNVTTYGATGDGTTDDTAAINAAIAALNAAGRGVLYFPAGRYKVTAGLATVTAHARICGDGAGDLQAQNGATTIYTESLTANVLTLAGDGTTVEAIAFENSTTTAQTAGAAIRVTQGDLNRYLNLSARGFYDCINIEDGALWTMRGCYLVGPVRYGLYVRHIDLVDGGDMHVSDCAIYAEDRNAVAGIRQETGGGLKVTNTKINSLYGTGYFDYGVDLTITADTSVGVLTGLSIENCRVNAIRARESGGRFYGLVIDACELGMFQSGYQTPAVDIADMTEVSIDGLAIIAAPARTGPAIAFIGVTNSVLGQRVVDGYTTHYTATSSTITDAMAGGSSGVSSVNGQTGAVVLTASEVGAAPAGSTGAAAELLMQDGVTSPPVPLETEDGSDWLYEG